MNKADLIFQYVDKRIQQLSKTGPWQTASLAKLRHGAGKPPGTTPEIWELTLSELPLELASYMGSPSPSEWAIHLALTLFAIHQQGKSETVFARDVSFGSAVSQLITPGRKNESGVKSRFDAVLTSRGVLEFAHHARGLVQLMRAGDVRMDYARFARDVYYYQLDDSQDRVRLRWGEDYYRINHLSDSNTEGE